MIERAIFHCEENENGSIENGRWYRQGEEPWRVRIVSRGEKLMPLFNIKADSYLEAFEKLYGHAPVVLPITRAPHHESAFGGD